VFVDEMARVFSERVIGSSGIQYWIPTVLRRIRLDKKVQERLFAKLNDELPATIRVPLLAMLGRALGSSDRMRQLANRELEDLQRALAPQIVFDVTTQIWRPTWQILTELAA
jgi:hypothetical protein